MPFHEGCRMDARLEFVMLASVEGANVRRLCRRFGISPTTGYKWLERWQLDGMAGLQELSRRPQNSPSRSVAATSKPCFRCVPSIRPGAAARSPGG